MAIENVHLLAHCIFEEHRQQTHVTSQTDSFVLQVSSYLLYRTVTTACDADYLPLHQTPAKYINNHIFHQSQSLTEHLFTSISRLLIQPDTIKEKITINLPQIH